MHTAYTMAIMQKNTSLSVCKYAHQTQQLVRTANRTRRTRRGEAVQHGLDLLQVLESEVAVHCVVVDKVDGDHRLRQLQRVVGNEFDLTRNPWQSHTLHAWANEWAL